MLRNTNLSYVEEFLYVKYIRKDMNSMSYRIACFPEDRISGRWG